MLQRLGDPADKSTPSLQQPEEQEARQQATAEGVGMLCLASSASSLTGAIAGNIAHAQRMSERLGVATTSSRPESPSRLVNSMAGATFSHHAMIAASDNHDASVQPTWLQGRDHHHHHHYDSSDDNVAKFPAASASPAPPGVHRGLPAARSSGVSAPLAPLAPLAAADREAFSNLRVLQVGGSPAAGLLVGATTGASASACGTHFLPHPTRMPVDSSSEGPYTSRASLPQSKTLFLFNERGNQGSSSASLCRDPTTTTNSSNLPLPLTLAADPEVQDHHQHHHHHHDSRSAALQRTFFTGSDSHGVQPEDAWRSMMLPASSGSPMMPAPTPAPSHMPTRTTMTSIGRPPLFSQLGEHALPVVLADRLHPQPEAEAAAAAASDRLKGLLARRGEERSQTGSGSGASSSHIQAGTHSSLALPFRSLQEAMAAATGLTRSHSRSCTAAPQVPQSASGRGASGATGATGASGGTACTFNHLQGLGSATSVASSNSQLSATSPGTVQAALMAALEGSGALQKQPLASQSASLSLQRQQSSVSVSAQMSSLRAALPPSPHLLPLGITHDARRLSSSMMALQPAESFSPQAATMMMMMEGSAGTGAGTSIGRGRSSPSGQLQWPFSSNGSEGSAGEASRILRTQSSAQSLHRLSAGSGQWGASGLTLPAGPPTAVTRAAHTAIGNAREAGSEPAVLLGVSAGRAGNQSVSQEAEAAGSGRGYASRSRSAVLDLKQQQQQQQQQQQSRQTRSRSPEPSGFVISSRAAETDCDSKAEPEERGTGTPDTVADMSDGLGGNPIAPVPVLRVTSSTEKRLIVPRSAWAQNLVVQHLAKEKGKKEEKGKRGDGGRGSSRGKGRADERRSPKRAKVEVGVEDEGEEGEASASHGASGSGLKNADSASTAAATAAIAAGAMLSKASSRHLDSRRSKAGAARVAVHQGGSAPVRGSDASTTSATATARAHSPTGRIAPLRIADSDASERISLLPSLLTPPGEQAGNGKQQGIRGGEVGDLVGTTWNSVGGKADAGDDAERHKPAAVAGNGNGDGNSNGNRDGDGASKDHGVPGSEGLHHDDSNPSGVMVFGVWMAKGGKDRA